jgi:hypothetical protein
MPSLDPQELDAILLEFVVGDNLGPVDEDDLLRHSGEMKHPPCQIRGERMEAELPDSTQGIAPAESDPAGIGPGGGTPYTVYFPSEEGYRAADLAHAAPLPQVGDLVDYLDEEGVTHRYRVREVVHTLQVAPAYRPHPRAAGGATDDVADAAQAAAEGPHPVPEGSELRAGLPEVVLEAVSEPDSQLGADAQRASTSGDPVPGSTSATRE